MNARSTYLNTLGQCCFALVTFCKFYSTQGYCGFKDGALHLVVGVLSLPLAATPLQSLCTVTISRYLVRLCAPLNSHRCLTISS